MKTIPTSKNGDISNSSNSSNNSSNNNTMPSHFICPLTKEMMKEPMLSKHGFHYERSAILQWLQDGHNYCPVSHKPLRVSQLISDKNLQFRIRNYQASDPGVALQHQQQEQQQQQEPSICTATVAVTPKQFYCPLTKKLMKDPVMTKTGINYERRAILEHLQKKGCVCPVTGKKLLPSHIVAHNKLQWDIRQWIQQHGTISQQREVHVHAHVHVHPKTSSNAKKPVMQISKTVTQPTERTEAKQEQPKQQVEKPTAPATETETATATETTSSETLKACESIYDGRKSSHNKVTNVSKLFSSNDHSSLSHLLNSPLASSGMRTSDDGSEQPHDLVSVLDTVMHTLTIR